jgi:TRAP-type C4-dicarboxylate transport system permease large subunit
VPLLLPLPSSNWDLVWFGVSDLTLKVALGQFTPPLAVNLMVSCQTARADGRDRALGVDAGRHVLVLVAVIAFPELALWLPPKTGLLANAVHFQ